jgi:hypothetical protein
MYPYTNTVTHKAIPIHVSDVDVIEFEDVLSCWTDLGVSALAIGVYGDFIWHLSDDDDVYLKKVQQGCHKI